MNHVSSLYASAAVTLLLCGTANAGEPPAQPAEDFFGNYAGISTDRRLFASDTPVFPPAPKSSAPPTDAEVETFLRGEYGSPEWTEAFGRLFYSQGELPVAAPADDAERERWDALVRLREVADDLRPDEGTTRQFARYIVGSNVDIPHPLGGGHATSGNVPRPIPEWLELEGTELQMIARPGDWTIAAGDTLGSALYFVNPTDTPIRFGVADSSLSIRCQALTPDLIWRDIDVAPHYWCGNSYHEVELDAHSAWKITVPMYASGPETRVRYRYSLGNGEILVSNIVKVPIPPELLLPQQSSGRRQRDLRSSDEEFVFEME